MLLTLTFFEILKHFLWNRMFIKTIYKKNDNEPESGESEFWKDLILAQSNIIDDVDCKLASLDLWWQPIIVIAYIWGCLLKPPEKRKPLFSLKSFKRRKYRATQPYLLFSIINYNNWLLISASVNYFSLSRRMTWQEVCILYFFLSNYSFSFKSSTYMLWYSETLGIIKNNYYMDKRQQTTEVRWGIRGSLQPRGSWDSQ